MHWRFSDEQESYRKALRSWLEDVAPSARLRRWLDDGTAVEFRRRFTADGWSGVGVAESAGGQGGDQLELALTAEELGRAAAPSAAWLATALATPTLAGRPDVLGAAFDGAGVALAVPADDPTAVAVSVGDDGRLSGSVLRVLAAAEVDQLVVPAADGDMVRLYLAQVSDDGVTTRAHALLDRSRSVADVEFDGVAGEVLVVDAPRALSEVLDLAGVLIAADSLGASERMLDMAVEYSLQRRQFGVPIGSFQAVKHAAAQLEVDVEAIRSAVYFAAASLAAGHEQRSLHASAVKAQAALAGERAADAALTMHGAIGYTWEHDLQLYYKRAKLDAHLFGDAGSWNERIAGLLDLV